MSSFGRKIPYSVIAIVYLFFATLFIWLLGTSWGGWADRDFGISDQLAHGIITHGPDLKFGGYTFGGAYYYLLWVFKTLLQSPEASYYGACALFFASMLLIGRHLYRRLGSFQCSLFLFYGFASPSLIDIMSANWNPAFALMLAGFGFWAVVLWALDKRAGAYILAAVLFSVAAQIHMSHLISLMALFVLAIWKPTRPPALILMGAAIAALSCFLPFILVEASNGWPIVEVSIDERSSLKAIAPGNDNFGSLLDIARHVRDYLRSAMLFTFGGGISDILLYFVEDLNDRIRYFFLFATNVGIYCALVLGVYLFQSSKRDFETSDNQAAFPLVITCLTFGIVFVVATITSSSYHGARYVAPITLPGLLLVGILVPWSIEKIQTIQRFKRPIQWSVFVWLAVGIASSPTIWLQSSPGTYFTDHAPAKSLVNALHSLFKNHMRHPAGGFLFLDHDSEGNIVPQTPNITRTLYNSEIVSVLDPNGHCFAVLPVADKTSSGAKEFIGFMKSASLEPKILTERFFNDHKMSIIEFDRVSGVCPSNTGTEFFMYPEDRVINTVQQKLKIGTGLLIDHQENNTIKFALLISELPRIPALISFHDTEHGLVTVVRSRQLHATYSGKFGGAQITVQAKNGKTFVSTIPPVPHLPFPGHLSPYFAAYVSLPMPTSIEDIAEANLSIKPIRDVGVGVVGAGLDSPKTTASFKFASDDP